MLDHYKQRLLQIWHTANPSKEVIMKEFSDIRRQQFLYPELYDEALGFLEQLVVGTEQYIAEIQGTEHENTLGTMAEYESLFDAALDRLSLEYTAGKPIAEVKALYPAAVAAFEAWCEAYSAYHHHEYPEKQGRKIASQVELGSSTSYVQVMRLLSLGVLFGEGILLRKVAIHLFAERNEDTIIEELFAPFVVDPDTQIEGLQHIKLYDFLVSAIWRDGEDSTKAMQKFLKKWYKFYEGTTWHNAHLRVGDIKDSPHWANYYGYWAWEAGAMAYLYELDDSEYKDNILYPKDLVAWARKQGKPPKSYTPPAGEQSTQLSNTPNSVCYKSGTQQNPTKKSS